MSPLITKIRKDEAIIDCPICGHAYFEHMAWYSTRDNCYKDVRACYHQVCECTYLMDCIIEEE